MNNIIPVTDFIRNFGDYAKILPLVDKLILTREGRPFAIIKAANVEKNQRLLENAGILENTDMDNDLFWNKALKRKNRNQNIKFST